MISSCQAATYLHYFESSSLSSSCLSHAVNPIHIPTLLQLQQPLPLQILYNLPNCILHTRLIALNLNLRVLWRFVRRTDTRELWDLALARLLVQALWVARLGDFEREVDEDLDEGQRGVVRVRGRRGVQLAGGLAVGFVGGDEGGDGDGGAVGEELGDLGGR